MVDMLLTSFLSSDLSYRISCPYAETFGNDRSQRPRFLYCFSCQQVSSKDLREREAKQMRSYIVVTYTHMPTRFEPHGYTSTNSFDDAMDFVDNVILNTVYKYELWMKDDFGWSRLRFQTNDKDHNNYVG